MTRAEHTAALYREGKSQRAIARTVGISQPAVRKWLLKLGLITPAAVPCGQGRDNLAQIPQDEAPQSDGHPPRARGEYRGPLLPPEPWSWP